jgi:hypothetical protein
MVRGFRQRILKLRLPLNNQRVFVVTRATH